MLLLSLFTTCAPLAGVFLTPVIALLLIGLSLFFKHGVSIYSITFGLPTIIATLCWIFEQQLTTTARIAKNLFNIVLPLACMIAFCLHPVGQQAAVYSFFWLIPPALFFLVRHSALNTSLRITFITHAVGSILWLYTMPTTPLFWLTLIPVVAAERLCLAGISTVVVSVLKMDAFAKIIRRSANS